jgi:putative MATE family efflux protein
MKDLTIGKESSLILKFALPMVAGNVFQNLYSIVDSIVVGKFLGKEALAAVGASFPIIFALISLVIGVGSGATIVISQYFGAKKRDEVTRTIDTIFIFLMVASIIITIVGISFSEPIFRLLRLPEEVMPQAVQYLNIYLAGIFAFFGFNGISSILRGLGDSKTPLYFMIFSTIANVILDLLFVIVFKWGIAGVAYATIIAHGSAFVISIFWLNKHHSLVHLSIKNARFDKIIFKECLRIGLPTGFQQSFVAMGMMALMGIVNGFGTNAVAAYSAALRIDAFAKMPSMNFASALSSFVGQNLGAGKEKRARRGFAATMFMSALYSAVITILILFFGESMMTLFTYDADVIRIGKDYLIIVSSFYLAFSAMFTVIGMLRGAGDTLIPMFITLITLWVIRIPLSIFLSESSMGVKGIWWAIPISWIFGAIASYIYYRTGNWKGKSVISNQGSVFSGQ